MVRFLHALDRTSRGSLAVPTCTTVSAGSGSNRRCNGCDEIVRRDEYELEVEVCGAVTLRFHAQCHEAWLTFIGDVHWRTAGTQTAVSTNT